MESIGPDIIKNRVETEIISLFQEDDYRGKINDMIMNDQSRLLLNLDDLRKRNPDIPKYILQHPGLLLKVIEDSLDNAVRNEIEGPKKISKRHRVSFEGNFGSHYITPRGLKSNFTNKLVKVQGIVTRMSIVRPKLVFSQHFCENTQKFSEKAYSDNYEISTFQSNNNSIPTHDTNGNPYTFEFGLSRYKDHQSLTIQELPERAPTGQLPRSVEIILEEDLVDKVKPGDRIEVVGVYKSVNSASTMTYGLLKTVIIGSHVYSISAELGIPNMTGEDIELIRRYSKGDEIVSLLSNSFCPSIYGHDQIKKALVLLLLGGEEKNLENGTHLRGDINIMFIGDPSTAKSQLLRSVLNIAPLATSTTGRGASGVGLTAAVTTDKETGERLLEAGAMVLADRGVICIDEFDKMNEVDRVAIHEVMEQQTVTIAKAGIHTSLNARCSVVAAANPLYGTYMRDKSPAWNIALPDSLLSRFDLLFIVLDHKMPELDRMIASRVIHNHCTIATGVSDDMDLDNPIIEQLPPQDDEDEQKPATYNFEGKEIFTRTFLSKYLHFAKQTTHPVLSNESSEFISQAWASLRSREEEGGRHRVVSITVRTLETMIRLSTAIAKAHLSPTVHKLHCEEALKLMKFAIFQEEDSSNIPVPEEEIADVLTTLGSKTSRRKKRREDESAKVSELVSSATKSPMKVTDSHKKIVFKSVAENLRDEATPVIKLDDLWNIILKTPNSLIEDLDHLIEIVKVLDHEGKFIYQEKEKNIILIL
jgi:DNA replication licensing factor MCM3